jgi:hypothetical protein
VTRWPARPRSWRSTSSPTPRDATKGFDTPGRVGVLRRGQDRQCRGPAGDTATGLGALSGAFDAAGFGPAADALNLVAVGMDAAEGSTILFKVAQESLSLTTIKDTAARIANTVATTAASSSRPKRGPRCSGCSTRRCPPTRSA